MATVLGRRESATPNEGRMTLIEHLLELRSRIFRSLLLIMVGMVVAWFFYDELIVALTGPYNEVSDIVEAETGSRPELITLGLTAPFTLQLKITFFTGIIVTSPFWLYQLWAFVTPALYKNERRYTLAFFFTAIPLFLLGVVTCFYALPKGIEILLSFTPEGVSVMQSVDTYFTFLLRLMVVFGLGYVLPVFVILLNLIGIVSAKQLAHMRAWIILGIFVFAAVATPTPDPFNMLLVALPITALYLIAEVVCRIIDFRRGRHTESFDDLDDDQASPLELSVPNPDDDVASDIGDPNRTDSDGGPRRGGDVDDIT